jgi:hypothetical protein
MPAEMQQSNTIFQTAISADQGQNVVSYDSSSTSKKLVVKSSMPMPSSRDAPRFAGKNLREFLADYKIGTGEAGWTEHQKCRQLPLYCKCPMRCTFEEVVSTNNWTSLKKKLSDLYHPEYYQPHYTWTEIEKGRL